MRLFFFVFFVFFFFFQCNSKRFLKKSTFLKPDFYFSEIQKINLDNEKVYIYFSIYIKNNDEKSLKVKWRDLAAYDKDNQFIGLISKVNTIQEYPKGVTKEASFILTIERKKLIQKFKEFFFNNKMTIIVKASFSIILPFIVIDYPLNKKYQFRIFD